MERAIGSSVALDKPEHYYAIEFNECVEDLLELEYVQKLEEFTQHCNTSRFQHSINVSYYSYLLCKLFGLDYRSAARAGLLHDLFLYDWRMEKQPEGNHAQAHPQVALRNAKKNVELNEVEADAIIKHMWPVTINLPKYKESYIVSLADKYCAVSEIFSSLYQGFKRNAGSFLF